MKELFNKLHEGHFSVLVLFIACVIGYFAGITHDGTIEVLGNNVSKMATYLLGATGLTALYGTLKLNVREEILTQGNVALGVLLAGLYIGLGFAIGG